MRCTGVHNNELIVIISNLLSYSKGLPWKSSLAWWSKTIIWAVSFLYSLLVLFSQVPSESRLNTGNDKSNLPSNEWNHQNMLLSYQVRQFTPINKYHSSTFYIILRQLYTFEYPDQTNIKRFCKSASLCKGRSMQKSKYSDPAFKSRVCVCTSGKIFDLGRPCWQ